MMRRFNIPWLVLAVIGMGIASVVSQSTAPGNTNACFWDSDTLAQEAAGFPGITEIITGRFDRYPPLYYEMRLDRVTKAIETQPDELGLYDDAGVASDRLGRHDEAIEWMARKREVLDRLAAEGQEVSEHEYRYLANLGTMHIHRWLAEGADREDMGDVELTHELIAAAIELNPDAHFGRERYQLLAIDWIRGGYSILGPDYYQPTLLDAIEGYQDAPKWHGLKELGYDDAIEGLSGLIRLGNAWESIDVFYALSLALKDQEHTSLFLLCQLRVQELIAAGKHSLAPEFDEEAFSDVELLSGPPMYASINEGYAREIATQYFPKARDEADGWVQRRQSYMNERLARGEHPDTDPGFWSEWSETTSPPSMPWRMGSFVFVLVNLLAIALIIFLVLKVGRLVSKSLRPKPA